MAIGGFGVDLCLDQGSLGLLAYSEIPMPANAVTPDEAKTLVTWVLSQK